MVRITSQAINACRVELYDLCLDLASTLKVELAVVADELCIVTPRELAVMRGPDHIRPNLSITRLAIIMLALQHQVNAMYFDLVQAAMERDDGQRELFDWLDDDDACPF